MTTQRKQLITLKAVVREDRRLVLNLPADIPTGPVNIVIESEDIVLALPGDEAQLKTDQERVRTLLQTANRLGTAHLPLTGTTFPTSAEVERAGQLPPNAPLSETIIRELRDDN